MVRYLLYFLNISRVFSIHLIYFAPLHNWRVSYLLKIQQISTIDIENICYFKICDMSFSFLKIIMILSQSISETYVQRQYNNHYNDKSNHRMMIMKLKIKVDSFSDLHIFFLTSWVILLPQIIISG